MKQKPRLRLVPPPAADVIGGGDELPMNFDFPLASAILASILERPTVHLCGAPIQDPSPLRHRR